MKGGERMKINKRGLSDVVTVSLIILLAIAAVVIVWGFVRPTIQTNLETGAGCANARVFVRSCTTAGAVIVENQGSADITSYRTSGIDTANAAKKADCASLSAGTTARCDLIPTAGSTIPTATVVAKVGNNYCPASQPVTCT